MGTKTILEMKQISKVYGNGVYANRNVSFSVEEGEIHALVGENGAGKSTLMKILFGMERPDHGEMVLWGKSVSFRSPQDAMSIGIGMVHQHFKLVGSMSVTENIIMGYEPMKNGLIDLKSADEKVRKIAENFELNELLSKKVGDLPVGTKQKVEIVKALYRGAKILILDEPTAVLTPQETEELFIQLKTLSKNGYTVIFISHKLREVKEISDRVTVMRKGEMIETLRTDEVSEADISAKMIGSNYSGELNKKDVNKKETLLHVKELCAKSHGGKDIVSNISFTVRAGEIVGIAGVEGNGQNELIEMIVGLRKKSAGEISLFGKNTDAMSVEELRENGLSYIPSDRLQVGLASSMTIEENLISTKLKDKTLYKRKLLNSKNIRQLSVRLVRNYRIKCSSPETEVNMLSGGNMQKVVVAREFTQGAKVIIAEQPTRGVDVGAAKFIYEELLKLRDAGCGILLVSADMEELFKLSDSIFVMYDGMVSAYIENAKTITENELGYYMLGVKKQSEQEIKGAYYEEKELIV